MLTFDFFTLPYVYSEEDQLLLYAVKKYSLEWSGLSRIFVNRTLVNCTLRYKLLCKKLNAGLTLAQVNINNLSKSLLIINN